jgi:hypothetical protein
VFLRGFGFTLSLVADAGTLRGRYLAGFAGRPPATARGELVCIADKR